MDPRFHRAAEEAAAAYEAEGARAVLLSGSAAREAADRFSDVDLYVVGEALPAEAARRAAIARAGGTVERLFPSEDVWTLDGVPVEAAHVTAGGAERTIAQVVERHDPDPGGLLEISAYATGRPLAGAPLLARLRDAALPYPDGLASAVVEAHAQIDHLWQLEAHFERDNPLLAYAWIADAHRRLLHALLAANRVYFFGFKRLDAVEARLSRAPEDLATRVRAAYERPAGAADLVRALAEDVYDLVEETVPGVDVGRLRRILRYRRFK